MTEYNKYNEKEFQLMRMKTLIEIYDREIESQGKFHTRYIPCKKCDSLLKQRKRMIIKIKQMEYE